MTLWAMSFPAWRCAGCRNIVEWLDAAVEWDDGKPVAVWHEDCKP